MSKSEVSRERRRFLSHVSTVAVAIPVASLVGSRVAFAADLPLVDEKSSQAAALQYVSMSTTEGKSCSNCALYQPVDGADGAGVCPLFQGSHVAGTAVCSAHAPKG